MGDMTLTQMETEIKANLGGRSDLDSRLVTFINWSQTAIARLGRFRELNNYVYGTYTVADQVYVSLPSGTRNLLAAVLRDGTNSRKLRFVPLRRFYELIPKPDEYTTGRPTYYTSVGTTLRLWRVPDDAYEIYFYRDKWPTALASASDTSDFLSMDEALCALATARAFRSLKMPEESMYWQAVGDNLVREALKHDKAPFVDEALVPEATIQPVGGIYYEDPFIKRMP